MLASTVRTLRRGVRAVGLRRPTARMRPTGNPSGFVLLLVALVCAASGCTSLRDYVRNGFKVGPNYLRPAAPVAKDWIDADDQRVRQNAEELHRWWMVFDDPTLDGLVVNASQQNLTLRQAGFRVLQARAARAIAAGNFFPQTQNAAGAYSRNAVSALNANTSFIQQRFASQWDVGFNLAWELDFWGRFRRAIEAADADLDASVENYDDVLVTLLGDVATTYVRIRTIERQLVLVRTNIQLQKDTLVIAEARFRGGQVSELDVDQARSNLAQTEALVPQYEIQLRQANNELCILLGIPPEDLAATIGAGAIPAAPPEAAVGVPANLLVERPDVRRAERQVAAQSARVGVAVSELYPHIAVTGTVGFSAAQFNDLFQNLSQQSSVGPSFQWNLLNYGRLLNNIRLQDARLAELIVAYQSSVLEANKEVENALVAFLRSQQRARSLAISVDAAARAADIALAQYRAGIIDFNRVALIEQNLVSQQDLLAQTQGQIAVGLVETYRALGGGWQIRLEPLPEQVAIPLPAVRPPPQAPVPAPVPVVPAPVVPAPVAPPAPMAETAVGTPSRLAEFPPTAPR